MNRRGFLRSMLCTAAAAAMPVPAIASREFFVGADLAYDASLVGVFTRVQFYSALEVLRREAVPGPIVAYVHPDHADRFAVGEDSC
jgi:hypothetical protein